jgi:hypothetical protein
MLSNEMGLGRVQETNDLFWFCPLDFLIQIRLPVPAEHSITAKNFLQRIWN